MPARTTPVQMPSSRLSPVHRQAAAHTPRQRWMSILAQATADEIATVWTSLTAVPEYLCLRPPEIGLVMMQGRVGGDGEPFNLGEITVTRCSVRLSDDGIGHAWIAGRNKIHAERAAVLDALMQQPASAAELHPLIDRIAARQQDDRQTVARKAAATRVEFFTMVRGED